MADCKIQMLNPPFAIKVSPEVRAVWKAINPQSPLCFDEFGGVLIAVQTRPLILPLDGGYIYDITYCSLEKGKGYSFQRKQNECALPELPAGQFYYYAGEWHTHLVSTNFSDHDLTFFTKVREYGMPNAILFLVTKTGFRYAVNKKHGVFISYLYPFNADLIFPIQDIIEIEPVEIEPVEIEPVEIEAAKLDNVEQTQVEGSSFVDVELNKSQEAEKK